jgi:hypothetical protein
MKRSMLGVSIVMITVMMPVAHARAPIGTFNIVASNSCHSNQGGFGPEPLLYELAPSGLVLATWEGTMVFLANGKVVEDSVGQYSLPGVGQPVGMYRSHCEYTSTTNNVDESITLEGDCDSDDLSGIAAGVKDHISPAIWRVTSTPNTILLSSIGTRTNVLTSSRQQTFYRICQGHGIGTK